MKRLQRNWPLLALVAGYLIASLMYVAFIPWGMNPDETAHHEFIQFLAQNGRLPVFNSSQVNYEAHQPPLYYVLALPFFWLSGLLGSDKAIRLLAVLTGAGVVACTYLTARRVYPREEGVALLAGSIAAFLPSQLMVNASVSNDSLATLIFSLFSLWVAARWGKRVAGGTGLIIGALVGLGILTKLPCLLLALLAAVTILLRSQPHQAKREPSGRPVRERPREKPATRGKAGLKSAAVGGEEDGHRPTQALVVAGATALILCGWWLVRNQILYGDPFAWKAFVEVFSRDRATPGYFLSKGLSFDAYLGLLALYTFRTFWGAFGRPDVREGYIFLPEGAYWIWLAVSGCILLGWIRRGWEGRRAGVEDPGTRFARWMLLLQIALLFAFFLRFNMVFFQGQARYLLSAATAVAIFLAWGFLGVFPQRLRRGAAVLLSTVFFAYPLLALLLWGLPDYSGSR